MKNTLIKTEKEKSKNPIGKNQKKDKNNKRETAKEQVEKKK
ncbi:hypothetical protein [Flavobacterium jejuense]|nr:hypothetical protein [Flavobacterium jejuense]